MNKIFQSQLKNSLQMKKLKISDATELKNGEKMDFLSLSPGININLNIDIDLHYENDFYEDLMEESNRIDTMFEEQCKLEYECESEVECQFYDDVSLTILQQF